MRLVNYDLDTKFELETMVIGILQKFGVLPSAPTPPKKPDLRLVKNSEKLDV